MVRDGELIFWLVALVIAIVIFVYIASQPQDLYYEGDLDKIGGKGGR